MNRYRHESIAGLLLFLALNLSLAHADEVEVTRLTWAGIKLSDADTTVLIDAVGRDLWDGAAPGGLEPVTSTTRRTYALVTHLHNDHFDETTLKEVLGDKGYVIAPEPMATHIASRGLRVIPTALWQPVSRGRFSFTPVPAEDGFGDRQVSWVISHGGRRLLHGGDTLWHGQWDRIGEQFGPFDLVFLPVNGVTGAYGADISAPATLTPSQAVDAATMLHARSLVPIHFGSSNPPGYTEAPEPLKTVQSIAAQRALLVDVLEPGESVSLE